MNTFNLDGIFPLDLSINIERTPMGARAYGIAFDSNANIVADVPSLHYIFYCETEIIGSITTLLLGDDTPDNIWDVLESRGLTCHCI